MSGWDRLLIVNADDFGLNEAANTGIVESYEAGAVTSTTLMANAPAAALAAELARRHPGLGIGLHFNLTWGCPLSEPAQVRALIGADGTFLDRGTLGRRLLAGRVPASQIALELKSQLARLRELGIVPTHVDSHQHVHGFGAIFDAVARHCADAGIPMRVPWVGSAADRGIARRVRRVVLARLLVRATRRWRGRVRWNDALSSVFDLGADGRALDDEAYRRLLAQAHGRVVELMVHPVSDARAMDGYTKVGAVGEAEWRYLRTGAIAGLAQAQGFRMGTYRDLVA